MDIQKLKERREQLVKEKDEYQKSSQKQVDDFIKMANAQVERFIGSIAMLDELIAAEEAPKQEGGE